MGSTLKELSIKQGLKDKLGVLLVVLHMTVEGELGACLNKMILYGVYTGAVIDKGMEDSSSVDTFLGRGI